MLYRQSPYGWDPFSYPFSFSYPYPYSNSLLGYPNYYMHSGVNPFATNQHQIQLGSMPLPYHPIHETMQPPIFSGQVYNPKPIQPPMNSLVSYFHDKDGNLDVNKMLSTIGQVSNTVKQVSPLFKQFGAILGKI